MSSLLNRNKTSSSERAESVLERLPSFNLLLVADTPSERDLLPKLIKALFGVEDVNLTTQTLSPQTPRSNSRITIVTAPSTSTAKEYIQAHQGAPLVGESEKEVEQRERKRIHAVWVILGSKEGAGVAKEETNFGGIPTLLVSASTKPASSSIFSSWAVNLRLSGVSQDLVPVDVNDLKSLAALSKRMETALVDQPDLRLLWVAAQRVSGDEKVATSIRKGMKLFSVAVGASAQPIPFIGGATGVGTLTLLQNDIVSIYNFPDPGRILLSKTLGNIFYEVATGLPVKWLVSLVGLSVISGLWEAPGSARTIMISIADLVLVLDALFYAQAQRPTGQAITSEEVKSIIHLYEHGKKKEAGAGIFRRDLVHAKLGKANISTFNVWKSLKREEAQRFLAETIEEHRFRG
ncbi:hypothetical protein BDY24DRAFT_439397 [Mrakia frigida]|uniref:uncharacterized protein n=1 Tax=Mrakia frigida TaxID=29902 RepID=UPI003FCC1CEB